MGTSIAVLLFILILAVLNPLLKDWIIGEKREKISETDGRIINITGNLILVFIAIYSLLFVLDRSEEKTIKWFFFILMIIVYLFNAFLEWKYLKNSKEFTVTLLLLLFGLIYFILIIF